jgi:hypothetical protein
MSLRRHLVILFVAALLAGAPALMAQGGHFEFGGHYGRWTLDILGNTAEKLFNDATEEEIQDNILEAIREDYPNLSLVDYAQTIDFDSSGDDFGFGIRWYPGGHRGSFSLGVSFERSTFKITPTAAMVMNLEDMSTSETATFAAAGNASAYIKATSFILTFRWDIFPSKVVHPYITFGGGISTAKALEDSYVSYSYSGELAGSAVPETETYSDEETKTLRELRDEALGDEENDFPIPNFIPFIQLNLGLKARLTKSIHILIDAGVFDGFMASAGLAIRL